MTTTAFRTITSTSDVHGAHLAALVERVAATTALWAPNLDLDATERHWHRIDVPEGVDVWAIAWPTFRGTELHSHGDATAAFTTVHGAVTEMWVDDNGRLVPRKFAPGVTQVVRPGEIHDVRNELSTPAVTIHAYSPRLTTMTYYRWAQRQVSVDRVVTSTSAQALDW